MFFDHGEKWLGEKKFGKMTIVCNSTQLVVEVEHLNAARIFVVLKALKNHE